MTDHPDRPGPLGRLTAHMNPVFFFGSALTVIGFVVFGGLYTDTASALFAATQTGASRYFGWFYVLVATGMLVSIIILAFSPARRIRRGGDGATPEFSLLGWFAMLFAAGMGVGLVYFGVAEPVMHQGGALPGTDGAPAEAGDAMRITFFYSACIPGPSISCSRWRSPTGTSTRGCPWRRARPSIR